MNEDIEIKKESLQDSIEIKEEFLDSRKETKNEIELSNVDFECAVDAKRLEVKQKIYVWNSFQGEERNAEEDTKYDCAYCWSHYMKSTCLRIHCNTKSKTKSRNYRCMICKADFTRSNHLKSHMTIHTGEKPYECRICWAKFSCSSNCKDHMKTHTGEKPYKCDVCNVTFSRFDNMTSHKRTHTGDRPYSCKSCDGSYRTQSSLKKHVARRHKDRLIRLVGDGLATVLALGVAVVFMLTLTPVNRGFFCQDSSIKYPYSEDQVSVLMLSVFFIILPSVFIACCEILLYFLEYRKNYLLVLLNIYNIVNPFLFSAFLTMAITYLAKNMVGRLRPYFIEVCEPDAKCNTLMSTYTFMLEYNCLKEISYEARMSFPSLHASISFHAMVFLCYYVEVKILWKWLHFVKTVFQVFLIGLAIAVCVICFSNNIHHWSDILGGLLLGTVAAVLSLIFCTDLVLANRKSEGKEDL